MIRYLLILFFAPIFCTSLQAQEATSADDFLSRVLRSESTYFQFDEESDNLFTKGKVQERYFEVTKVKEVWFFYEHSHVKESISYQCICQIDLEEAQKNIRDQIAVEETESGPTAFLPEIFRASGDCLFNNWVKALQHKPVLEEALMGQRMLPEITDLDTLKSIDFEAQLLRSEDDRLVLDLKMELPDSLELVLNWGTQLHYLRSEKQYYYPAPDIPEWKANLVRNGFLTNKMLNAKPDPEKWEETAYRYLDMDTSGRKLNVQVLMPVEKMPLASEQFEANGQINLDVTNNQLVSFHQVLSGILPGERYQLDLDEQGTVTIEELGLWFHHEASLWRRLTIYEIGGDTLARFERGEKPHSESFYAEAGKNYAIHAVGLARKLVKIPFQLRLSANELGDKKAAVIRSKRKYFRLSTFDEADHKERIEALYAFYSPPHQQLDTFILKRVHDDTGKDLLKNQVDSISAYAQRIQVVEGHKSGFSKEVDSTWEKGYDWQLVLDSDSPFQQYQLKVLLWDFPQAPANAIYLEGEIQKRTQGGAVQQIPWYDTLQLGMPLPFIADSTFQRSNVLNVSEKALLPASWITIGGADENYFQGLEARFNLKTPLHHFFVRTDLENSTLEYLHDNKGYDLLQLEEQMRVWNQEQAKTSIEPYDYSYDNLKANGNIYYGSNGEEITFKVSCRAGPTSGATQVVGRATIAYSTFDETQLERDKLTIPYENQEEIRLVVDGHILQYERSMLNQKIGEQVFNVYQLQTNEASVFVAFTVLFDGEEILSPDFNEVQQIHHLYIPENFQGEELNIGVLFAKLHHHRDTIDFEISMEGLRK